MTDELLLLSRLAVAKQQEPLREWAAALVPRVDWAQFATLVRANNLEPLVQWQFQQMLPDALPATLVAEFRRVFQVSAARTINFYAEFERMSSAFSDAGIPAMPLKGLLLGDTLYANAAVRPMNDIDLLVHEVDYPRIDPILQRLGFAHFYPGRGYATQRAYYQRCYIKWTQPSCVSLELHHRLGHASRYRVDYDAVWKRSVSCEAYAAATNNPTLAQSIVMCKEDNLLHNVMHRANHVFDHVDLRSLLDFHEIVTQWRPDWELIVTRAAEWGILAPLYLTAAAAQAIWRTDVPPWVFERSAPGLLRRAWLRLFLDVEGSGQYRFSSHPLDLKRILVGFALIDRAPERLRFGTSYFSLRVRDVTHAVASLMRSRQS